ncbi:MAG: hypothetical protein WBG90_16760 [Saonia sp.]
MIAFEKKDIEALDSIINHLVENGSEISEHDHFLYNIFKNEDLLSIKSEFNRLASIIHGYDCAQVYPNETGNPTTIVPNGRTASFKAQGGFKKAYADLLKSKEHSEILKKKERDDARLSDWRVKTFWPLLILGTFGGIYSGIDLIEKLTNNETDQNEVITKQQLESEFSNFRNSMLIEKENDTLSELDSLK